MTEQELPQMIVTNQSTNSLPLITGIECTQRVLGMYDIVGKNEVWNSMEDLCRKQQILTIRRMATWLRMNIGTLTGQEIGALAENLDLLADTSETFLYKNEVL